MHLSTIVWDPQREILVIPFINWPLLWYSLFFALGFILGFYIFKNIIKRYLLKTENLSLFESTLKKRTNFVADKVFVYVLVATIVGARLGHILFYENAFDYFAHPIRIFKTWEGGLASHGAALAIAAAIIYLGYFLKKKGFAISWLKILDLIAAPVALAGAFIRIGNFFNQEILGKASSSFFAIIFVHPMDGSLATPRHPVQLYEAICYFFTFLLLLNLTFKPKYLYETKGKLIGLFFILVFGSRFLIEFLKEEQSIVWQSNFLAMGQLLSIPLILIGLFLFFKNRIYKSSYSS
ncbi:MAG: prolipoprotein diacylglyceryl transferase [Chlamydiae bacterium]|nr:prolipoprotein diacylglyceryl transferase [Chlamydiota bacterium]